MKVRLFQVNLEITIMSKQLPIHKLCEYSHFSRVGVGPTGNNDWMIRVDSCVRCGYLRPAQKITWKQWYWVIRWNKRIEQNKLNTGNK